MCDALVPSDLNSIVTQQRFSIHLTAYVAAFRFHPCNFFGRDEDSWAVKKILFVFPSVHSRFKLNGQILANDCVQRTFIPQNRRGARWEHITQAFHDKPHGRSRPEPDPRPSLSCLLACLLALSVSLSL